LINEQRALLDTLNRIVRDTEQFRAAESAGKLIKIPTGDGMALVFYQSPETPVECALEISRAARQHPDLKLRMGVHSGPVSGIVDVTGRPNLAGAGLNMAQRVMDCGDAGHILLSRHIGEDLEHYKQWRPHLHDLGECEVKHGMRVAVVNLYTKELGNPDVPEKLRKAEVAIVSPDAARRSLTAIVEVFLKTDRPKAVNEFRRAIQAAPEGLQAYYVTGDADFILIVTAKDMHDFSDFAYRFLSKRPYVKTYRTSVVMRRVKWEVTLAEKTDH
jgi:DNA-binding Lrp family transcriptional regulator